MKFRIALISLSLPLLALAADPAASGVDAAAMNKSVDPCVDFYQYACGNWIKSNPLPADRSRWGRFGELQDRNEKVELDIIQGSAVVRPGRSAIDQKIGDAFAACMDTQAINSRGLAPVKPVLDEINTVNDAADVVRETAALQRFGISVLFSFGAQPDAKDSTKTIATLGQGGLSLPDRDYYLKTDPKSVEIRQHYLQHIKNLFMLVGATPEMAAQGAQSVLEFETIIARASADRVAMRDPNKRYHIMTRQALNDLAPDFGWDAFFKLVDAPAFTTLNVSNPDYLKQLESTLRDQPIEAWRAYFAFHVLRSYAPLLPDAFQKEAFDFWQHYLTGVPQERPRQFRCVQMVDRSLGKLQAITNNVGYPRKWRDYGNVEIKRDDYFGNSQRLAGFLRNRQIEKIGAPTDKTEWGMSTPTVNAFYSPQQNSINFPAGILQSPFFDPRRDLAVNYGAVGAVIGHEMTHGFDDQGRKFDGDGNLRDWWTPQDGAEFEKRAACIANEYSGFTSVDDVKLNGKLTLGENSADNGGLRVAYMALEDTLKGKKEVVDGLTPEQRFFVGFAQVWCENVRPEEARSRAMTDPHSPGRFRVDGTLQNMPEFQKAYACKAGQPMVSANACRVW
jgi:putative endopeptidase